MKLTKTLPYSRPERVSEQLKEILASACLLELSDARLNGVMVTKVIATKDLRQARVYFHMLDATERSIEKAIHGFVSASGYLKRVIGKNMNLKYVPEMKFFYDDSFDEMDRITELMHSVEAQS